MAYGLTVEFIMEPFHGKCTASHHHSMASTVTSHRHHRPHPFHFCHHHHCHHYHHSNSCTLKPHSVLHHKHTFHPNRHFHFFPRFAQYPPPPPTISQEPDSDTSVYNNNPGDLNFTVSYFKGDEASEAQLLQEEFQEEEDEKEPIYVMTDEWAEFFAKSEEKRRLEKNLAKKKNKKKKKGN